MEPWKRHSPEALDEPQPLGRTRRPLLYVAEDDDEIRHTLVDLFRLDGFDVESFCDGGMLFDRLFRGPSLDASPRPDVLVTDHRMPSYSGLDILTCLREVDWTVPVVLITAFGSEVAAIANAQGATAVLPKPFDPDDLRLAVMLSVNWSARQLEPRGNGARERQVLRRARRSLARAAQRQHRERHEP